MASPAAGSPRGEALQLNMAQSRLGARSQKRVFEVASDLAYVSRAQLRECPAVRLPPARSKRESRKGLRQRYGIGSVAAEAALLAARARLSMAGAVVEVKSGAWEVQRGPAMPSLPAREAVVEVAKEAVPKTVKLRRTVSMETQEAETSGGRPGSTSVFLAAAKLVDEVKAALARDSDGEEAAVKQQKMTQTSVKSRFHVGSQTAAEVLRVAKARLSMAGLTARRQANRQVIYRQPEKTPADLPARKAQETRAAELEPSALLHRLRAKTASRKTLQHLRVKEELQVESGRKARKAVARKELSTAKLFHKVKEEPIRKRRPRWRAGVLKESKPTQKSLGRPRKSRKSRRKASWRWSKLLRPLRQLRQYVLGKGASSTCVSASSTCTSASSTCASASSRCSAPRLSIEILSICQVPGWSMRLVMFLAPGMLEARTLASTCRRLAWSLLRDSAQVSSELRPLAVKLRDARDWRSSEEAKLEETGSAIGVLAALLPLEPHRSPSAVAAEAATAANVAARDAKARWPCRRPRPLQMPLEHSLQLRDLRTSNLPSPPFGRRKRRSSVSSLSSVSSRKARCRVLAEATSDLDRARVARLELLLKGLSRKVTTAVDSMAQDAA
mmetsp:Transcript_23601/g.42646  ORF Transcript_23601/g.42646 Transcript_23601/m.42646 type:complete len:615 (+) Transcript_23601:29-1873(+)